MSWFDLLKNQISVPGLSMRSMDLDNIIEEDDDDDCIKWFMEFQKRMVAISDASKYIDHPYAINQKMVNQVPNDWACEVKDYYKTSKYPASQVEPAPEGVICDAYVEDAFDIKFAVLLGEISCVVGPGQFMWEDIFSGETYSPNRREVTNDMADELSQGKNKNVKNFYDTVIKAIEHWERPDIVKLFKDNFKLNLRYYLTRATNSSPKIAKDIDNAYR